jgi:hypothetical protein
MKEESDEGRFIAIGILIITVLLFAIFILIKQSKNNTKSDSFVSTNLSLDDNIISEKKNDIDGKYKDKTCNVSFDYPKNWVISNTKLPLSQEPLSETMFNELDGKNSKPNSSILFFICYDAKKYSFDQFIAQNPLKQGQAETIIADSIKWQRVGNFAYTIKNDKLVIFQMFFTKYDLKPKVGYEEIFLNILKSVE